MSDQGPARDEWLTSREIAEALKVTDATVRRWVREGDLPALALGRKAGYRIRASDLEAFIAARFTHEEKAAA